MSRVNPMNAMADPNADSTADEGRWFDLVTPVAGLGLRVPKIAAPLQYGLLRGIKPS